MVFLVFAALNPFVAIAATSNGSTLITVLLILIIGLVLFNLGRQKEKREEDVLEKKMEDDAVVPEFDDKSEVKSILLDDNEECDDYPKPMFVLSPEDMQKLVTEEFLGKSINIAAEGGTKEQTQVKFEVLLGKREKTEAMLAIEKPIRDFFYKIYNEAAMGAVNGSDKPILRKLAVTTSLMKVYNEFNDEDGEFYSTKEQMTQLANRYGVSVNLIENEEKEKVIAKYSK